jgi:outer membrane protein assembly factor BamB
MKSSRSLALLAALSLAAAGMAGCGTVDKINPFHKSSNKNKILASKGERIPLLAYNQTLEVSDALRGQEFFLPDPQPVALWPQPGGAPGQWVENLAAASSFQVAWRASFGEKSARGKHITAPPVGADGKVFVMDAEAGVFAFDAQSGRKLWGADLDPHNRRDKEAFGGGVAYLDGKLYVTSGYRFVAALDAASGKLLWRQNVDAPIHGAPVIADGRVMAINIDDELQTFNAETGTPDWTYQGLTEPARILKASSPAVAGDTVVAAFASGELVALRASNGNESWTQVLSRASRTNALSEIRDIAGRPVVYRGDVLAGSHSGVFMAVDLRSGQPRWTLPVTTISTPWPAGDVVFIVSKAGEVVCASRESGQVYWLTELNKGIKKRKNRALYTGPVLASGRLIVVSNQGEARALDPKTGAVQSSIKLSKEGSTISPMAMDGTLYVVTDDAKLVAIR